ncbi:MAG: DUF835 domain-containing protein, partial [Thermoplasmata archaeon]
MNEDVEAPGSENIEELKGSAVLFYEVKPRGIYGVYRRLLDEGLPGLCVSTTFPGKLKKTHKFESEVIWISESSEKGAIKPGRMEFELMREVSSFIKNNKGGVLVLDCIETLILENGFDKVVKFLKKIGDMAAVNGNTVLAVINDQSMEKEKLYVLSKNFDTTLGKEELEKVFGSKEKVEKKLEIVKEEVAPEHEIEIKAEEKAVEAKPEIEEKSLIGREAFTNGLKKSVTAREAYTNGLRKKEKAGYVNGLKKEVVRKPKARNMKRVGAGIVIIVVIISIFTFWLFSMPTEKIKIDGNIDDWAGIVSYKDSEDFLNPDINIAEYSVYYENERAYFYAKVSGTIFNGRNNGYDVLTIFVDRDGNASTGYRIENLGADAKIEIGGYEGTVRSASVSIFEEYTEALKPEMNYSAWRNSGDVRVEVSGNIVE